MISRLSNMLNLLIIKLSCWRMIKFHFRDKLWNIRIERPFYLISHKNLGLLKLQLVPPVRIDRNVLIRGAATVKIGRFTTIGRGTTIECNEAITIGNYVMIAENVSIRDSDHNFDDITRPMRMQNISTAPVTVGNDVWLGYGVVVTKGVTIGDGCVIGANSVVTRDIPPYSVAVGAPARIIRKRG